MNHKATIGTISAGTHRPQDLIPTFLDELKLLDQYENKYEFIIGYGEELLKMMDRYAVQYDCHTDDCPEWYTEETSEYLNEDLFEALNNYAPPYCSFGANEGDGADFGFWVDRESVVLAVQDEELLKVNDLSEVSQDYMGPILVVNDHGNMTLCTTEQKFVEQWSIV